jgi:hypothetical protein
MADILHLLWVEVRDLRSNELLGVLASVALGRKVGQVVGFPGELLVYFRCIHNYNNNMQSKSKLNFKY